MVRVARLKAYKNGRPIILIERAITKACTLVDFQDMRIRYIENTKNYYDRFETTLS